MAKTFYYDSVDLLESAIIEASATGGAGNVTSISAGDTLTTPEASTDQSLATSVGSFAQNDVLQYNLGSAKAVDFLAVYFSSEETDDIDLEFDTASDGYSEGESLDLDTTFSVGWTVSEFSEQTKRYWRIISRTGDITGLSQVILGKKLAFEINPDIGISEIEEFGTDVNTSIGGVEYAIKRHEPKSTFSMNFSNISQTFKNNLQSMEAQVQNYKKFIYSEDGTSGAFHYVRLESPIQFEEVAYQRYSASFTLREQLS